MRSSWIGPLLFSVAASAAVSLAAGSAIAGPNAGGTLILHDAHIVYSAGLSYCNVQPLADCDEADGRIDGSMSGSFEYVFKLYAAFPQAASPRLAGLIFGIQYDAETTITGFRSCADFELPMQNWPASGFGTAVTWNSAQLGHLTEVYWFAAYSEEDPPHLLQLIGHPTKNGMFADDAVPGNIDPVAGYSSIGFGTDGIVLCPDSLPPLGACCRPGGQCVVVSPAECAAMPGNFSGGECDPSPCVRMRACCSGESCTIRSVASCAGEWHEEWETCNPNPCATTTVEADAQGATNLLVGAEPNPIATSGRIVYRLGSETPVRLEIFDAAGRTVRRWVDANQPAGRRSVLWDTRDDAGHLLPSGTYFVRVSAGNWTASQPIIVAR